MRKLLLAIVVIAAFQMPVIGEISNPYISVVERNMFGLSAPERAVTNPPVPAATIKIFGIVNLFGYRQVITQIDGANYILREGEVRNGVEVMNIQAGGTVEVMNHGIKQLITDFALRKAVN